MQVQVNDKIPLVVLLGPTASGKTRLGAAIARHYDGEVVSADSMQIYKGMDIATAKPTQEEMCGIPHHLIGTVESGVSFSVADYVALARQSIEDITNRGKLPVLVGGTGLYIDSLLEGTLFSEDSRDESIRAELISEFQNNGLEPLLTRLYSVDPAAAVKADSNPKRVIRALEVFLTTGITKTEHDMRSKPSASQYRSVLIALNYSDRQKLYSRINARVDKMLESGLLQEAKVFYENMPGETARMAIGCKELIPYFEEKKTLCECVDSLKRETRRYAKRQITWFKRNESINWLNIDETGSFEDILKAAMRKIDGSGLIDKKNN